MLRKVRTVVELRTRVIWWCVFCVVHCWELRRSMGSGMFGSGLRLPVTPCYENWHLFFAVPTSKSHSVPTVQSITFYITEPITPMYTHTVAFINWYAARNFSYIGQTGSSLDKRFKEHIRYATSDNPQSAHIILNLHSAHECGPYGL